MRRTRQVRAWCRRTEYRQHIVKVILREYVMQRVIYDVYRPLPITRWMGGGDWPDEESQSQPATPTA